MTFVAQPYEQFVDDLLTALTGGMIREEHRFVETEESYSLSSPGAIPFSVRVFGQRNETFAVFEGGIDYDYLADDSVIKWKTEGKIPDERSYFYVNYYLQEGRRQLTDRNPGSVTTTLAEAFSREFGVLHKQMELIYQSAFVDLATGVSLDHVAALLGLTRKDAKFATGGLLFKRSTPAPGDITIPVGSLVSTDHGQNFETTVKRTLRRGQLSIVSPIRAQVEGPPGRVGPGLIVNINRPIFGIESAVNEEATFFATEKETDEEFRRRIKGTLERAGKATHNAIKYGLIEDISEITEGNIQVMERPEEPGIVDVKLGLESRDDPDLVRQVEESIFQSKAAGVRVFHNLATRTKSDSIKSAEERQPYIAPEAVISESEGVSGENAAVKIEQDILDSMDEGILNLRANIYVRLSEQNLSALQKEEILDDVRQRAIDYIESLPMGAEVIYNKILGIIIQPDEISDVNLLVGPGKGQENDLGRSNIMTTGRKPKISDPLKDIYIRLMEEAVFIDIMVFVKPNRNSDNAEVSEELKEELTNIFLEKFRLKKEIAKDELRKEFQDTIHKAGFYFAEGDEISINAEFEETGRLLNNAEKIVLDKHQAPILNPLKIEIRGALDG